MPYGDVFTRINREYYQLTSAEKKIADYMLLQRQECQYMSISEMLLVHAAQTQNHAVACVPLACI